MNAPLIVTPAKVGMAVGETQIFQALNASGDVVSPVTWTVDDPTIVQVASDPTLGCEALAIGTTRITAAYNGQNGEQTGRADVQVLVAAGQPLPAGTERWSAPAVGNGSVLNVVQSLKVDADTPDLYVSENSRFVYTLRAMNADGTQKWVYPAIAVLRAADNKGGVLATTVNGGGNALSSIDKAGNLVWSNNVPGINVGNAVAVRPDGTVYVVATPHDANYLTSASLNGYNGDSGLQTISVPFPQSTASYSGFRDGYHNPITNTNYTICDPNASSSTTSSFSSTSGNGVVNPLVIGPDGSVFAVNTHTSAQYTANCTPQNDDQGQPVPWNGKSSAPYSYVSYIDLIKIDPGNSPTVQTVDSISGSGTNWNSTIPSMGVGPVIPDTSGGAILIGSRTSGSPTVYQTNGPSIPVGFASATWLIEGGNNTVFVGGSDGQFSGSLGRAVAFDRTNGTTRWTYASTLGPGRDYPTVKPNTGLQDGSVVLDETNGTVDKLTLVDPSGTPAALFTPAQNGGTQLANAAFESAALHGNLVPSGPDLFLSSYWSLQNWIGSNLGSLAAIIGHAITPDVGFFMAQGNPHGSQAPPRPTMTHFEGSDKFAETAYTEAMFRQQMLNATSTIQGGKSVQTVAHTFYLADQFTDSSNWNSFSSELKKNNQVVAYIGHGLGVENNPSIGSIGFCFPRTLQSETDIKILDCTVEEDAYYQLTPLPTINYRPFKHLTTEARIVFIAACDAGATFLKLWNIGADSPTALVVPTGSYTVHLAFAARYWVQVAGKLAKPGETIEAAVSESNTWAEQQVDSQTGQPFVERWKVISHGGNTITDAH